MMNWLMYTKPIKYRLTRIAEQILPQKQRFQRHFYTITCFVALIEQSEAINIPGLCPDLHPAMGMKI